jgi:uncharacterized membrane protein YdjX (TVP38/TMEM64 family)
MIVVRIVPLAPFTIINLAAGASHIRFRDFALGSLLGMVPGITGVILLTDRVENAVKTPGFESLASLLLVTVIIFASGYLLSRKLLQFTGDGNS